MHYARSYFLYTQLPVYSLLFMTSCSELKQEIEDEMPEIEKGLEIFAEHELEKLIP